MRLHRSIVAFVLPALVLTVACAHRMRAARSADNAPVELAGTLEPLRDYFNAQHRLPRVVLLLSPT